MRRPRSALVLLSALFVLAILTADAGAAGLLVPRDRSVPPIAVRSHRVSAVVSDGLARTTLRQTFVNPTDRPLEAIYLFPLPEDAALVDVAMETGGQRLEGLLVERKRARKIYDDIVRTRRDPALVEQVGRAKFRLSVFPVLPRVETVVELTWIQRVPLSQGVFRYVYPLALGEGATETEQDFTFSILLESSVPFTSVTSPMKDMQIITKGPNEVLASFERMRGRLDRDIVVEGRVSVEKATLSVKTYREKNGDGWFLAVITPPEAKEKDLVPRDVILVMDTSGSMRGEKIEQARASALHLLQNLRSVDRVNVLRFSSTTDAFAEGLVPATAENIAKLREFVMGFKARGGTALGDALKTACDVPPEKGRVRNVVMLTDGLPTMGVKNPAKIVGYARAGAGRGLRVFCFGVGDDVNPALLEGISQAGRGRAEIFKPEDEIESRLTAFLRRTASPVIADIDLTIYETRVRDVFPRHVPDAYLGEQVVIVGRYRGGGEKKVLATATVGDRPAKLEATVDFREEAGGSRFIAWLFAKEKLAFLEEALRLRSGLSDAAYYAALDRGAYDTADEIVDAIIGESLTHGVQSAYTSFLVLLPEDRRRIDPSDEGAIAKAMERARKARAALAPATEAPPDEDPDAVARVKKRITSTSFFGGSFGGSSSGGRGPAGEVSPGQRDPTDPQAPPESPGVPTPGPAVGPAADPPGGGTATPGGKVNRPAAMTFDNWLFWWAYNKDEILDLKWRLRRKAGAKVDVRPQLVPALTKILPDKSLHADIRSQAVLALARCGGVGPESLFALADPKAGEDRQVQETALLALGILGRTSAEVREFLIRFIDDTGNPFRARCFALVALGLLREASPATFDCVMERLDGSETTRDVPICALLALGLIGDSSRVPQMVEWLEKGRIGTVKLDDLTRSYLVGALGRIGHPGALEAVAKAVRRKGIFTKRSVVIALGQILPQADPKVQLRYVGLLAKLLKAEPDVTARNFGLIALGRIGGKTGVSEAVRSSCVKTLIEAFEERDKTTERPFAALALGLIGHESDPGSPKPPELRRKLAETIRGKLVPMRGDKVALGALAISLGMIGDRDPETVSLLVGILRDRGQERKLRGSAAIALGLIGDPAARDPIRTALAEREDRDLRADTALAAGLLGDAGAVDLLVRVLDDPKASQFVLGSVALALGRIGDPRASRSIAKLLQILEPGAANGRYPDLTRALVAVALGQIGSRREERVLSRISKDLNYRASVPALDELLTIQ